MTISQQHVTVVTGAGQGIGKAIATRFHEAGHVVVIAEIDEEAGSETLAELEQQGTTLLVTTDIKHEDQVRTLITKTTDRFARIDNLINNAAISCNKPITELSLDEWNNVISTNLTGTFLCSKYAAPYLAESGGSITNICSTRARMSEPHTEAYAASKGAYVH